MNEGREEGREGGAGTIAHGLKKVFVMVVLTTHRYTAAIKANKKNVGIELRPTTKGGCKHTAKGKEL